jgi:hypothetical protein
MLPSDPGVETLGVTLPNLVGEEAEPEQKGGDAEQGRDETDLPSAEACHEAGPDRRAGFVHGLVSKFARSGSLAG